MVDISKIKPGDMVVLKPVKIISIQWYPGEPLIADVGGERVIVQEDEISEHIPAPREFKVGDLAVPTFTTLEPVWFKILALHNNMAAVQNNFGKYEWVETRKLTHKK